jgi:sphingomyelin phosphodiesterase acid-like 3
MPLLLAVLAIAGLPAHAAAASGTFAVITDIHFSPFDPPDIAKPLAAAEPDAWQAILDTITAQPVSGYGADTNHALFESALQAIGKTAADVDFALVPGDFLVHRFRERAAQELDVPEDDPTVKAMAWKTTIYVVQALRAALGGKPVIVALGNNDSACGNYLVQPDGPYLAAVAKLIGEAASPAAAIPDFDRTFREGGYYALPHPSLPGTTVLVLNDVLWSQKRESPCVPDEPPAGDDMLAWLEGQLALARGNGERVWLVRHIPAGADGFYSSKPETVNCADRVVMFLEKPYVTRLPELLNDFADVITASFIGHTHHDSYRLIGDTGDAAHLVEKITPAISPVYDQNPSFQIFSYDPASGEPTDFSTYYLTNIGEASLAVPGNWTREYTFTEAYGVEAYSADTVAAVMASVARPGAAQDKFRRFYPVSHGELSADELNAHVCAARSIDRAAFIACYCRN